MNWLLYAILAQFLWAIVAHLDKHILSGIFKNKVGTVMLISTFFMMLSMGIVAIFKPEVLKAEPTQILYGTIAGFLYMSAVFFYFHALKGTHPSTISILWLLTGPITYILGFIFFDELPTTLQLIGGILIFFSGVLAVIEKQEEKYNFNWTPFILMLFASVIFSFSGVAFKYSAVTEFWDTFFYDLFGSFLFGLILFFVVKEYRQDFIAVFKYRPKVLLLNAANEFTSNLASLFNRAAMTLGPLAIVYFMNGLNPIFVFILGLFLVLIAPKLFKEDMSRSTLILKIIALFVSIVGIVLLEL